MAFAAPKTGADAIATAMHHICMTLNRYRAKLDAVIDAAVIAGAITSAQATVAHDFLATAGTVCLIFDKVAEFNDIDP